MSCIITKWRKISLESCWSTTDDRFGNVAKSKRWHQALPLSWAAWPKYDGNLPGWASSTFLFTSNASKVALPLVIWGRNSGHPNYRRGVCHSHSNPLHIWICIRCMRVGTQMCMRPSPGAQSWEGGNEKPPLGYTGFTEGFWPFGEIEYLWTGLKAPLNL